MSQNRMTRSPKMFDSRFLTGLGCLAIMFVVTLGQARGGENNATGPPGTVIEPHRQPRGNSDGGHPPANEPADEDEGDVDEGPGCPVNHRPLELMA